MRLSLKVIGNVNSKVFTTVFIIRLKSCFQLFLVQYLLPTSQMNFTCLNMYYYKKFAFGSFQIRIRIRTVSSDSDPSNRSDHCRSFQIQIWIWIRIPNNALCMLIYRAIILNLFSGFTLAYYVLP